MSTRRSRRRVGQRAQAAPPLSLEDLFEAEPPCTPDKRPKVEAAVNAGVHGLTHPATIVVRLQVTGRPDRLRTSQTMATTSEAILWTLWGLIQELDVPTRVTVRTSDPTVHRVLSSTRTAPPWLRRASDALDYEASLGDVSLVIAPLEPGDEPDAPYGVS